MEGHCYLVSLEHEGLRKHEFQIIVANGLIGKHTLFSCSPRAACFSHGGNYTRK